MTSPASCRVTALALGPLAVLGLLAGCGGVASDIGNDIGEAVADGFVCGLRNCTESSALNLDEISPRFTATQAAGDATVQVSGSLGKSANLLTTVLMAPTERLSASVDGSPEVALANPDGKRYDYTARLPATSAQPVVQVVFTRAGVRHVSQVTLPPAFTVLQPASGAVLTRGGAALPVRLSLATVGTASATGVGPREYTFALLDIERRREAEVRIAQAQASLQRIIDTAPLAIALFDSASGMVLRMNHMAAMFFGRPMEAVLGRQPDEWFGPADAAALRADLQAAQQQNEVLRRELPRPVRSGSEEGAVEQRTWDVRIVSLQTGQGDGPGEGDGAGQLLLVASDVTEQRAAEQARFEAAIAQREMLVKEVHHRIKNNLQGVAGLMQQVALRRPEVAPVIAEAIGQVQAIAHVYGLQVGAGGPLRVKSVLESITGSVQRMFGRPIVFSTQGPAPEGWALPEAESIPLALTVNELLTNAVKHSRDGEVRCTLVASATQVAIEVVNRGQLPAGFELARVPGGVSGLGLVRALLPRRSATLTLQPGADADGLSVVATVTLVPPGVQWLG